MHPHFIELNRGFEAFQADEVAEIVAHRSYAMASLAARRQHTWASLLQHPLVVILGEPGSGKSEELRAQHRLHKNSFLIGLERLVREPVREILSAEEFEQFQDWKNGTDSTLILLDAVDESKLRHDGDFAVAVERLSKEIGTALSRARFVITSRVSEWRPQTDLNIVSQFLLAGSPDRKVTKRSYRNSSSVTTKDAQPSQRPIVVVLQPLLPQQVRLFIEQRGARDAEQFMAALQKSNALPFAGRPLDVTHLYAYWQEKRHLSNLTDVVDFMVTKLLTEVSDKEKRDPLSPMAAREGAEYLAAAAILCKNLRFGIPDEGHIADEVHLSPAAVLPEGWQPSERRALMDRALFDSASRGTLSFHHRSHVEYLAARWVERLMENNCGFEALKELFFADINGKTTLRGSLAPIAAWLISAGSESWRERLASLLLTSAPEIHLQYGDPGALPLQYKKRVLAAIAGKYRDRRFLGIHVSIEALTRLAEPGLSDDINAYLVNGTVSDGLKRDLLMVVSEGALAGCIPTVLQLFSSASTSDDLRSHCVHAIRFAGTSEHKSALAQTALKTEDLSNVAIGHIFETLYPDSVSASEALSVLKKVTGVGRYSHEFPSIVGHHLTQVLRSGDAAVFLRGFVEMLRTPPMSQRSGLSTQYHWVMSLIPHCLVSALAAPLATDAEKDTVLDAVSLIDEGLLHGHLEAVGGELPTDRLRKLLREQYDLRRRLFWRRFDALARPVKLDVLPVGKLNQSHGLAPMHMGDVDWLLRDLDQNIDLDARLVTMTLLLRVLTENRASKLAFIPKLKRAFAVPELRSVFVTHLWGSFTWPIAWRWQRHIKHKLLERWWWRSRWHSVRNSYHPVRNRLWLWCHLDGLRKGKYPFALFRMAHELRSDGGNRFSTIDWDKAKATWGDTIASCMADGFVNAWQTYMPKLPHEHRTPNTTPGRVIVGLVGLQELWQSNRLNPMALERLDVERAVRYACNELNGLPDWFFELANTRADDVVRALTPAISAEFHYPESMQHVHEVVAKLANAPVASAAATTALLKILALEDPQNSKVLEQVLTALYRIGPDESTSLGSLAPSRVGLYEISQRQWQLWMGAWLRVDSMPALRHLQSILSEKQAQVADQAMEQLCAHLAGGPSRRHQFDRLSFLEPKALAVLIPLVFAHVRPLDDIDRADGGVYSPTARDNAQDFRYRLMETLRSDETSESDNVLCSLLSESALSGQRDWILSILEERQGRLADPVPWMPEDVRVFARMFCHEPRSDYQLYRLASRLLLNVKNDVERSENAANRKQVRAGDVEAHFRGFLTRHLNDQSMNWFAATQESEVDLGQRPDIRVEHPGLNAVPIEVKLANLGWTIEQLKERLENQLVGQYLRPAHVSHGIYVIGTTVRRRWELSNGRRVEFSELVSLLQRRAAELVAAQPHEVHGLEVIGIDFSDPREQLAESEAVGASLEPATSRRRRSRTV